MRTCEPSDFDDMTLEEALDAVRADVRDHPITADPTGLFTVMRHIDLLCHLTARAAGEAAMCLSLHHFEGTFQNLADTLSQTAIHLGRATAHYTQAVGPVVTLNKPGTQATIQRQFHAIDAHSRLRLHLDDAARALSAAQSSLTAPRTASGRTAPAPPPGQRARRIR
ncbi:hypothetical protein ACH47Z_29225 [Streptomyces sp. NPDC020192]|uniref:hypothetical protein n=1 Tax=Streptomyces sp. NPDC020192 TaxID=3365066 RepID=UPI003797BBB8